MFCVGTSENLSNLIIYEEYRKTLLLATDRQTDGQRDGQTDRQMDRQTDRQTDERTDKVRYRGAMLLMILSIHCNYNQDKIKNLSYFHLGSRNKKSYFLNGSAIKALPSPLSLMEV